MILKLKSPITQGGTQFDQLELREPTIAQCMEAWKELDGEENQFDRFAIAIVCKSAQKSAPLLGNEGVSQMKYSDLLRAYDFVSQFPIGKEPKNDPDFTPGDSELVPVTAEFGGETLTEIFIVEPTAAMVRDANAQTGYGILNKAKVLTKLLASVTGKNERLLMSMSISDWNKSVSVLKSFLEVFQPTTRT